MTEIVRHEPQQLTLSEQEYYASIVTQGDLVPKAYRNKPANAMIAIGLGQAMGLNPAESLYRIDVIQGKPTASAELIASNIRKAGHILRVQSDEQNLRVTATVYRADDPEFPHTVVRDIAWAQKMGLVNKDNYKKQPLTMLEWRAISAVGRLAASEALYGVQYTPDELQDLPRANRATAVPQPVADAIEAAPEFEPISEEQWSHLLQAGHYAGLSPNQVAHLASQVTGKQLRGWQDIPADQLDSIIGSLPEPPEEGPDSGQ